ncbi:hypothetical protein [Mycoplasma struthionis]|uniref:Uncharacterized protein n=1 Tax=Mycoplasma struthionis TaxID=538220 RepID=A0A502M2J9_9MOLU|nr:hypothetical protein [Mycoplasma struthionis]TPI02328.1 hypothetical protein FJM01_01085 [Mycoplasma struthionis]
MAEFSNKTNLTTLNANKISEIAKVSERGITGDDLKYLRAVKGANFINHAKKLINSKFKINNKKVVTLNDFRNINTNGKVVKIRKWAMQQLEQLKATKIDNNWKNGSMSYKGNNTLNRTNAILNLLSFLYVNKDKWFVPKQADLARLKVIDDKNKIVKLSDLLK